MIIETQLESLGPEMPEALIKTVLEARCLEELVAAGCDPEAVRFGEPGFVGGAWKIRGEGFVKEKDNAR